MKNVFIQYAPGKLCTYSSCFRSLSVTAIFISCFFPINISAQCTTGCGQSASTNVMPGTNNFSNTFCITTGSTLTYNQNFDMNGGTVCIGPGVTFSAGGGNYNGNWTINNYGNTSRNLSLNSGQTFHNYGTFTGSLTLNGGTVINYNGATLTPSSFNFNGGSFTNNTGGIATFGSSVTVNSGATFVNNGTLTTNGLTLNSSASATLGGTITINGDINNNGAINTSGVLTVTGNYNQNSSGSISSSSSAQCNALNITGTIQGQGSYNGLNGLALNKDLSPACGGCLVNGAAVLGAPANQITGAVLTSSANSISGTISDAGGSPAATHYIVLRRIGGNVTNQPSDFVSYAVGNIIGSSTVVAVNPISTLSFTDANIIAANACGSYRYAVFPFNSNGTCVRYNRTLNGTNRSAIAITSTAGTVGSSATICPGSASSTLTLTGYTGSVVRWEYAVSPFSSWTSITNTTNTYSPGVLTQTTQFRAVVNAGSGCSNANAAEATITVADNTPPVITCPANISTNTTTGICGAAVTYSITATDNCSGGSGCIPTNISSNYILVGTYGGHTYYRSNFSANWATAKANAIALGGHLLTLSSAAENNLFNGLGSHWAGFTDEAVEGTFVWVTGEPVVFTNWAPGEPNDYNAAEDHMQLNWNASYNWNDYTGTANYPYVVEFECVAPTLTMVTGLASGSVFPTGSTTVTYNATDAAGNTSANCSFTVTVNDVTAPSIACPANISVNAPAGTCEAVVTYNEPVASDNCGSCSSAPAISGYTALGVYNGSAYYISNATATAPAAFAAAASLGVSVATINSAGENTFVRNAATAAGFNVTYFIGINDVTTEGSFTGYAGETLVYTNWNTGEPNNSGNEDYTQVFTSGLWNDINGSAASNYILKVSCITPVRTSGLASGSTFPLGTSTINYSATDPSGNISTCSFTVTVSTSTSSTGKTIGASANPVCANSSTNITVASSDNGVSYQLRDNATNNNIGTAVTGTGGTINLPTGNLNASTTFNIYATPPSCVGYQLTNTITVTVNPAATVSAGSTVTVCQSATPSAITLSGASVGGGAATGAWSITAGGGTLSSTAQTANPATVTYTPANNYSGTVTLTLTTNDPAGPCGAVSSTKTITVSAAATVTPGTALSTCQSSSPAAITLSGASVGGSATTGAWTVTAGGGTLSSTAQTTTPATVTYTPDANYTGTVTLTLTTDDPAGICDAVSNTRTITVNAVATVTPGSTVTVCQSATPSAITLSGASVGGSAATGAWSITAGGGTLSSTAQTATPATVTYTPANNYSGTVTLTLTTNDPSGPCGAVSSTKTITVSAAATVIPGTALATCQSSSPAAITLSGASVGGSATTGAWVITAGGGTLSSTAQTATPATVTYTPDANYTGTVTLTLTTDDPAGICDAVSNTRTITVNPSATVTPGSTVTVCQSATPSATTLSGASVGGSATTGAWSITSGGGTLSSTAQTATPATIAYTPAANYSGTVTLTLTTNDPAGPCGAVSNTRTITVNAAATVTPGTALTTCQSSSPAAITLTGASVGGSATTGAWSVTSGGGTLSTTAQTATPATITYTPDVNYTGTVTLTLTTDDPAGICDAVSNTRTITVNAAATVTPGSTLTACQSATPSAITLSGASVGGSAATGAWSITAGGGTLSSTAQTANPATVTYTPAANYSGTVTLTLTTNDPTGPCGAVSVTRTITVNALPTNITPTAAAASVCSGSGTNIQIPTSQAGVNYQLRNNTGNVNIGSPVAGTGGTINLPTGNLTSATTFNVLATDATTGCNRQLTTTVTVSMDNIQPVITCPATQTVNLNSSCQGTLPSYISSATVSDNCTATGSIVVTQSPAAGTTLSGSGTQAVTLTATDAAGNFSTCTFNVTKQDVTAPVITCPSNITVNASTGTCGAVVNYTISATDNCAGSSNCAPSSISGYTLIGTYNGHVYFRSTASSLWSAAKSNAEALGAHLVTIASSGENSFLSGLGQHWAGFTDEVTEGTWAWVTGEPIVYTSWNTGEPNNGGNQDYMVINYAGTNWDDQGAAVSLPSVIEFDCLNTNMVSGYASGSVFPTGTTTVTYNATDAAGNTSTNCSFTVTVNDVTAPTIVCPANISVNAAAGACDAVVTYNTPVASDNCGSCSSAPSISGYTALGVYNGSAYYISNAGATCTAAFTAASALGASVPTINSSAENTFIRNAANTAGFTGSYLIGINDANTEGTFVGFAGETLTYTNWNAGEPNDSGNEDYTQVLNNGSWNDVGAGTSGNYILKISCITPVRTAGLASGSTFSIGTSPINYSATDPYGNNSTCSFTVTVAVNPTALNKTVSAAPATICAATSTNITVAASDNGISYQLRENGTNASIGSPVTGTGGTINLPTGNLSSTTTFNVYATGSSCSYQLTNTVTVTVNPAATVTPGSILTTCQSATPSAITLSGASVVGSAATGAWSVASGGGTLSSTAQTATPATVTYTPAANYSGTVTLTLTTNDPTGPCGAVSETRTITVNALPTNITPSAAAASVCSGTGTNIQIPTSQTGVNYQLRNNTGNVNIGSPVAGNGGTINLPTGNLTTATTFNVLATDATTGCSRQLTNTVSVSINALPTDRTATAVSSSVCSGSATNIQVPTSQTGVTYQLRNNTGNVNIGSPVAGNTFTINLPTGVLTAATTFNVLATNSTSGCSVQMTNTVTVTINPAGQWVGGTTGDWNTASNWCGGVPTSSTNTNIPAGVTVSIQSANAVANSVNIASTGALVMAGTYNLNISAGGTFTNNGTFTTTSSTGTVAFLGNGTISGTTTFKNIDAYGAIDFGTASTIGGIFSIQTGGSVTGHSPTYTCPTSVLLYRPGSTFSRGLEWTTASSGAGYPANVQVQNNTTINFPAVGNGYICYDLQIDAGSSLRQDYSGGSASMNVGRNVTINGTLSLGSAAGGNMSLGGNWVRNTGGIFNSNDRLVTFNGPSNFSGNGTSMSTITAPSSSAKDNEGGFGGEKFAHIWIDKTAATDSVVLLSNITVTNELGLSRGTLSLRNSDVTIVSNETRTADVAPISNIANVNVRYSGTGKFVIQRFIHNPTNVRAWRLLGVPLQSATAPSINQAWQEGVVNPDRANPDASGGIYNPWPGYGTHISGPGGLYNAANGWDHGTNSASVLYVTNGLAGWTAPANTTTTKITDQQGWMLFIRGSRSFAIGNQYVPSQNTILEPKGRINIGNVVVPVIQGKQVIANPYPSAISLVNTDVAGISGGNSTYYMWDPKFHTSFTQPGKWVSFTGVGSSFVQTTSQSAYTSNGVIESGQAFVLEAANTGNVTFHESDKLALTSSLVGITSGTISRPMSQPNFSIFRTDILVASNSNYLLTDGVLNIFGEGFDNEPNAADATKLISFNTKESMSILRDTVKLAIEKRSDIIATDTIFLRMSKFNELPYRFRFAVDNFEPGIEAFLEDNFTNTVTPVSMTDTTWIDFNVTADSLSKASDRFRVVFKRQNLVVLPVTVTSISATKQENMVLVKWSVEQQGNMRNYDVQRSADGIHFVTIGQKQAAAVRQYSLKDASPINGINYYRIKMIDRNGDFKFSNVALVNINRQGSITVYPNPVENNTVQLMMTGQEKGNYKLNIYSSNGQLVHNCEFDFNGTDAMKAITINKVLPKGIYNAEVLLPSGKNTTIQIAVQ